MNFTNGLAKDEFLQHMFEEFSTVFDNTFSRTMLMNIVNYATADDFTHTKNDLYYFLSDMIPEVVPDDLIPFIDKSCLTNEVLSLMDFNKDNCDFDGVKVFHLETKYGNLFNGEIKYWSNTLGQLFDCGKSISVDELPLPLLDAYYNIADLISDGYKMIFSLVETSQGFGIALSFNDYDDDFADENNFDEDELFESALKDAKSISAHSFFDGSQVFLANHGTCCHLVVVLPVDSSKERLKESTAILDSLVYKSAKKSLNSQIQSASTRAAESKPISSVKIKEPEPER